jgi:hypothetical protein
VKLSVAIALLSAQLWWRKQSWIRLGLLALITLSLVSLFAGIAKSRHELSQLASEVAALVSTSRRAPPITESRAESSVAKQVNALQRFEQVLGAEDMTEQYLKQIFALAAQQRIELKQGEYELIPDAQRQYRRYQVTLPVQADYSSVRRLTQAILLALPFASLDELQFRRGSVSTKIIEAKIRLTLYLKPAVETSKVAAQ